MTKSEQKQLSHKRQQLRQLNAFIESLGRRRPHLSDIVPVDDRVVVIRGFDRLVLDLEEAKIDLMREIIAIEERLSPQDKTLHQEGGRRMQGRGNK